MNEFITESELSHERFEKSEKKSAEKFFTIGNGKIIQQGNFEEFFSGETISGSYIKISDKKDFENSKAWKIPYNQEKEVIINSPDWTPLIVRLNDEVIDLNTWEIIRFRQILNLKEAFIERTFELESPRGFQVSVRSKRFISFAQRSTLVIYYNIRSLNFEGRISMMPLINGNISNDFTEFNQLSWNVLQTVTQKDVARIWTQIRLHNFHVCNAMAYSFYKNNEEIKTIAAKIEKEKAVGFSVGTDVRAGDRLTLYKFVNILSSEDYEHDKLAQISCKNVLEARNKGWNTLFEEHLKAWEIIYKKEISNYENMSENEKLLKMLDQHRQY